MEREEVNTGPTTTGAGERTVTPTHREWPAFLIDAEHGDPHFVEEIKKAIHAFNFTELSEGQQISYRLVATEGADSVLRAIWDAVARACKQAPSVREMQHALARWAVTLGEQILSKIPESRREELLPYSSVEFLPLGNDIVVECRSLIKVDTGRKPFWYSRLRPTVEVEGRTYTVAFSDHAVDSIKKRINPDWKTYAALGDVYAYLERCTRFDVCELLNPSRDRSRPGKRQLALSFYDICFMQGFWQWGYVTDVLGLENLDPNLGLPFYRLGYCPAFLDEAGGFIRLGTLLCPGYAQTPEYGRLQESNLPPEVKARLEQLAVEHSRDNLLRTCDFSAIKWFHENGTPQVIHTRTLPYRIRPKREYCVTERIQK